MSHRHAAWHTHCTTETKKRSKKRAARVQPRPRILIVEDSHSVGDTLACALEQEGCSVLVARTGREGIGMAKRARPDVIALDVGRACQEGTDALAALGADPATRGIPIVALSAGDGKRTAALRTQVARVFGEPFYLDEVVAAVLEVLDELTASTTAPPATRR